MLGVKWFKRSSCLVMLGNCSSVSQQVIQVVSAWQWEMDYNTHMHNSLDTLLNSVQVARLHCYFRCAASATCSTVTVYFWN